MGTEEDRASLDQLFDLAHAELRRLSILTLRRNRMAPLSPTTLVHEAWLKLAHSPEVGSLEPLHFRNLVARAMRQIVLDFARRRHAKSRGSGQALITFDEQFHVIPQSCTGTEILALDEALSRLARLAPRQAQLVEARFFGGLTWAEAAKSLGVSEATVMREWRVARAWLAVEMRGHESEPHPEGTSNGC
jgi:RNA polymerase sigma-70 factor, ECF subfamily